MNRVAAMLVPSIDRCFPLTAAGPSALATVRFAGQGVHAFIAHRLSRALEPSKPTHVRLHDDRGIVDDPIAVLRADGLALDLTTHGGATIAAAVRALAEQDGFRWTPSPAAKPWDDEALVGIVDAATRREHELLVALPHARTELAVRTLLAQRAAWDRFEREMPDAADLAEILDDHSLDHLLTPPTVAIVGLPNAGKSTLANALFGTRRSIVSPVAGTTRDWVGEPADLDGLIVTLIDTPGLRQSADEIEQQAITHSRTPIASADLVVLLLDATRDDAEQRTLQAQFPDALPVVNKLDARLPTWTDARVGHLAGVGISAASGEGLPTLIDRIHDAFDLGRRPSEAPRIWTRRQFIALGTLANTADRPR